MSADIHNILVSQLGHIAAAQDLTLANAESCTGGMMCSALVANPEASSALERGFVVYSVDAKCELLGLDRRRVEECAGVSEDIARAMARAAIAKSHADLGIAITGFAGPRENDEGVGLVHIAAARDTHSWHQELHLGDIGREAVCKKAVSEALELAITAAQDTPSREATTVKSPADDAKSVTQVHSFDDRPRQVP